MGHHAVNYAAHHRRTKFVQVVKRQDEVTQTGLTGDPQSVVSTTTTTTARRPVTTTTDESTTTDEETTTTSEGSTTTDEDTTTTTIRQRTTTTTTDEETTSTTSSTTTSTTTTRSLTTTTTLAQLTITDSSSTTTSSSTRSSIQSSSATSSASDSGSASSAGTAIGITVAVLAVVGILLAFFMVRRNRQSKADQRRTQIMSGLGPGPGPFAGTDEKFQSEWAQPERIEMSPVNMPGTPGTFGYPNDRHTPIPAPPLVYPPFGGPVDEPPADNFGGYPYTANPPVAYYPGMAMSPPPQIPLPHPNETDAVGTVVGGVVEPGPAAPIGLALTGEEPGELHRVVGVFQPSQDDELYFGMGDMIKVLVKYDDGWALGTSLVTGQKGVFPLECTVLAEDLRQSTGETGSVPKALIPGRLSVNPVAVDATKMKRTSSMFGAAAVQM